MECGPAAVVLTIQVQGPWLLGVLANNVWSVAGASDRVRVNQFLAQPSINYNFPDGTYLTSSPVMTANWVTRPSQQWTVPLDGDIGKVFKSRARPLTRRCRHFTMSCGQTGSKWTLRVQVTALFPTN